MRIGRPPEVEFSTTPGGERKSKKQERQNSRKRCRYRIGACISICSNPFHPLKTCTTRRPLLIGGLRKDHPLVGNPGAGSDFAVVLTLHRTGFWLILPI